MGINLKKTFGLEPKTLTTAFKKARDKVIKVPGERFTQDIADHYLAARQNYIGRANELHRQTPLLDEEATGIAEERIVGFGMGGRGLGRTISTQTPGLLPPALPTGLLPSHVGAIQPSAGPVQSNAGPVQPSALPGQPTGGPVEPSGDGMAPGAEPVDQSADGVQPSAQPVQSPAGMTVDEPKLATDLPVVPVRSEVAPYTGRFVTVLNPSLKDHRGFGVEAHYRLVIEGQTVVVGGKTCHVVMEKELIPEEIRSGVKVPLGIADDVEQIQILDDQPSPVDAFRVYDLRSPRPKDESLWGLAAPSPDQVKDCMPHVDGILEGGSGWLVRASDRFVEVPISWSQWFEGTPTLDADGHVDGHQIDLLNLNLYALEKMEPVNLRKVIFRLGAFSPQSETVFSRGGDGEEIRCLRPTALALMATAFLPKNDLFVSIVGNQADKIVPDLLKFRHIDFFAESGSGPLILAAMSGPVQAADAERRKYLMWAGADIFRNMIEKMHGNAGFLNRSVVADDLVKEMQARISMPTSANAADVQGAYPAGQVLGMMIGGVADYARSIKQADHTVKEVLTLALKTGFGFALTAPALAASAGSAVLLLPALTEICNSIAEKTADHFVNERDWNDDIEGYLNAMETDFRNRANTSGNANLGRFVNAYFEGIRDTLRLLRTSRKEYVEWKKMTMQEF